MLTKDEALPYLRPLEPIFTGMEPRGYLGKKMACLIFDLYGTLFISGAGDIGFSMERPAEKDPIERLLREFNIRKSVQETLEDFHGAIRARHGQMKTTGVDFPEVEIDRIWMEVLGFGNRQAAREFAVRFELTVNPVFPMPHARDILSLCQKKGVRTGIISNAQFYTPYLFRWFFDATPRHMGFDPDLLIYSYRTGRAKPSASLFRLAVEQLAAKGIAPASTLYIGNDMLNDIYPARRVGMKTALFAGDARSLRMRREHPLCKSLAPDLILTDLDQLKDMM